MFRSENKRTIEKAERSYVGSRESSLNLVDRTFSILLPEEFRNMGSTLPQHISTSLSPSAEDIAVCDFYYTTLDNLSNEDDTRLLHMQLPALYSQSPLGSALRLATHAIAFACSTRFGHEAAKISRERYVTAVKAVEMAIRDPVEFKTDQTLYAILLLSGFEVRTLY
jgi:hypothetical protein